MTDTPKKKRGNPNFKRGVRNPYSDKVKAKRWKQADSPKELVENSKELGQDKPVEPAKPPEPPQEFPPG
jgi:hypothetical protein